MRFAILSEAYQSKQAILCKLLLLLIASRQILWTGLELAGSGVSGRIFLKLSHWYPRNPQIRNLVHFSATLKVFLRSMIVIFVDTTFSLLNCSVFVSLIFQIAMSHLDFIFVETHVCSLSWALIYRLPRCILRFSHQSIISRNLILQF